MTDSKPFVIVAFEDGVQLVPNNWVLGDKCYWPSFKSNSRYDTAVKNLEEANPNWPLHPARIIASFATYEMAKPKLKLAEELSDLNSDGENLKKSRAKRRKKSYSSESETETESDDENLNRISTRKLPEPPTVEATRRVLSPKSMSNTPDITRSGASTSQVPPNQGCCSKLAREIAEIKMVVKDILNILTSKTERCNTSNDRQSELGDISALLQCLPLKSMEEVVLFEEKISTEEEKQKLAHYFSLFGGTSVDRVVKVILRKLFSNEVAAHYSWSGGKKKQIFSNLKLAEVILCGVRGNFPNKNIMEREVIESVKNWLRHGKARALNEARKTQEPGIEK